MRSYVIFAKRRSLWGFGTLFVCVLCGILPLKHLSAGVMPKYAWRGYMLDCSRHFFTVDEVKKTLDAMKMFGLNVFHWHLTDDSGWRVQIDRYPELTKSGAVRQVGKKRVSATFRDAFTGAYGPFFYTKDEIREIVRYAAQRDIRVVPEVDLPGHCGAATKAYPELLCNCSAKGNEICLGKDNVIQICEDILNEVMELFPDVAIHLGGDECSYENWSGCLDCQRRIGALHLRDEKGLLNWFTVHFAKYLEKRGRRLVGWDDILDAEELPKSAIIMAYRASKRLGVEAARRGYDVVETPASYCYLDYEQGIKGDEQEYQPFGSAVTWKKISTFDPAADYPLGLRSKVLGAQGNLWTELVCDCSEAEWHTWPRLAALADVLCNGPASDDVAFSSRMVEARKRLIANGINAAPLGPVYEEWLSLGPGAKCLWVRDEFAKLLPPEKGKERLTFDWDDGEDNWRKIYARYEKTMPPGSYLLDLDWLRIEIEAADAIGLTNACQQLNRLARRKANEVLVFPSCRISGGGATLRTLPIEELCVRRVFTNDADHVISYLWAEPRHMQLGGNYPLRILSPSEHDRTADVLNAWRRLNYEAFLVVPDSKEGLEELISEVKRSLRPLNRNDISTLPVGRVK